MKVELRILRYDPESSSTKPTMTLAAGLPAAGEADSTPTAPPKPHWVTYQVEVDPMDRVLDLLIKVKAEQDGSLSFRRSCGHGICGSDAMLINNRNRLACRIRVDQLGKKISVAPLPGLPVVKDLIVDMSGFFGKYRSVKPYLINDQPEPERERRQSAEDRARYDDTTKCILCAACTSVLPVVLGPARVRRARRRSSRPIASSSTRATKARPNGWRSSPTRTACGAAARSSTASTPARAASTSPGRSSRSPRRSWGDEAERAEGPGLGLALELRRCRGGSDRVDASEPAGSAGPCRAARCAGPACRSGQASAADHPNRRRGAGQPRAGVPRRGPDRRVGAGSPPAGRRRRSPRSRSTWASRRTT